MLSPSPFLALTPSQFPRSHLVGNAVNKGNGAAAKVRAQAFYTFCATFTRLRNLY
jgi:hypothetical protein